MEFDPAAAPPDDTSPPSVAADLAATTPSAGQVQLTWSASSDNKGVAGYAIFRNDQKIAVVRDGSTQYLDTFQIESGQSYRYRVSAYDLMANASDRTPEVTVTAL